MKVDPQDLEQYAEMEGSELGEYWGLLASLGSYTDYMEETFRKEFEKEVAVQLAHIKNNMEILEEEVTYTRKTKSLVNKSWE